MPPEWDAMAKAQQFIQQGPNASVAMDNLLSECTCKGLPSSLWWFKQVKFTYKYFQSRLGQPLSCIHMCSEGWLPALG